ncbi:MAG: bifunctional phosphopantothenoylcysteine decarboxylase/phosphopantothenate--cysteine ligase CoaBC [Pseudomonadota bacterium]
MAAAGKLEGKRVLVGVSGGIAAYKSALLVRRLREQGAEVQVVMTAGAAQFITPLTLQALSGNPVRDALWDEAAEAAMGHIELARWADLVLIAPATAHLVGRLAHGLADDLLCTVCLATEAPVVLAPAMNRVMWQHPATEANCQVLAQRGVALLGPGEGSQACGEEGAGRMLEPEEIVTAITGQAGPFAASGDRELGGLRVLLTAGPTREALDPVRFLSNRSSGKMGYAVAQAAAEAGAEVTLVSGPTHLGTPSGVTQVDVESARSMHDAVMARASTAHIFIGTAAVADYECREPAEHKLKKAQLGDLMVLELHPAPDILAAVAALAEPPFTVGFAAETRDLERNARAKLERKRLDMIAGNVVGAARAFDCADNEITVFWVDGSRPLGHLPKLDLARSLVAVIGERYRATRG